MKAEITNKQKDFEPIEIKLTIETKEELEELIKHIGELDAQLTGDFFDLLEEINRNN